MFTFIYYNSFPTSPLGVAKESTAVEKSVRHFIVRTHPLYMRPLESWRCFNKAKGAGSRCIYITLADFRHHTAHPNFCKGVNPDITAYCLSFCSINNDTVYYEIGCVYLITTPGEDQVSLIMS